MKRYAALLLVLACTDATERLATAPCLWTYGGDAQLMPGSCWYLEPPPGMAVTPSGSSSCVAEHWTGGHVWQPQQRVSLWTRSWVKDDLRLAWWPMECPESSPP